MAARMLFTEEQPTSTEAIFDENCASVSRMTQDVAEAVLASRAAGRTRNSPRMVL